MKGKLKQTIQWSPYDGPAIFFPRGTEVTILNECSSLSIGKKMYRVILPTQKEMMLFSEELDLSKRD